MKALAVVGRSGSGKTTLITRLIPELARRGLRVSTVKHTHHDLDLDTPGKDTFRHRRAGAAEVVLAAGRRWVLMAETPDEPPDPAALLARLAPVDLVLVEGAGGGSLPRIEVARAATGRPRRAVGDPHLLAVAGDAPPDEDGVARFGLDDVPAIAAFIVDRLDLE